MPENNYAADLALLRKHTEIVELSALAGSRIADRGLRIPRPGVWPVARWTIRNPRSAMRNDAWAPLVNSHPNVADTTGESAGAT